MNEAVLVVHGGTPCVPEFAAFVRERLAGFAFLQGHPVAMVDGTVAHFGAAAPG